MVNQEAMRTRTTDKQTQLSRFLSTPHWPRSQSREKSDQRSSSNRLLSTMTLHQSPKRPRCLPRMASPNHNFEYSLLFPHYSIPADMSCLSFLFSVSTLWILYISSQLSPQGSSQGQENKRIQRFYSHAPICKLPRTYLSLY